jgi:hypothetical protein
LIQNRVDPPAAESVEQGVIAGFGLTLIVIKAMNEQRQAPISLGRWTRESRGMNLPIDEAKRAGRPHLLAPEPLDDRQDVTRNPRNKTADQT